MFTSPSVDVADTRLFARTAGGRQIVVYEMSYAASQPLAMVLPLPVASRDEDTAVKFIDLSRCPDFFECLTQLVWLWEVTHFEDGLLSSEGEPAKPPLRVHEVGAFDASFVPSLGDFDRVDARFQLPPGVFEALPQYADYGFAVFKLRDTAGALKGAHPMAFDFSTRMPNALFLPTVHVHDGRAHRLARFDHIAYLQGRCAIGGGPRYFADGRELGPHECTERDDELWRERSEGWKFARSGERFGVMWPVGPSEVLRDYQCDPQMRTIVEKVRADPGMRLPKSLSWMRLVPVFDPNEDLYALGMSGLLPNADTVVKLEPA